MCAGLATDEHLSQDEARGKRAEGRVTARRLVREHDLPMKVVGVDYVDSADVFTIYFSAPHRVDFRALVRDLAVRLHARVELRQIGPRDEARLQGGIGPCGRDLCCATFLKDFEPVSVRMAKDQDLPVNPMRIAGACGRLMCCLKYEHPLYQNFRETRPGSRGGRGDPGGPGRGRRPQRARRQGRGEARRGRAQVCLPEGQRLRIAAGLRGQVRGPGGRDGRRVTRRPWHVRPWHVRPWPAPRDVAAARPVRSWPAALAGSLAVAVLAVSVTACSGGSPAAAPASSKRSAPPSATAAATAATVLPTTVAGYYAQTLRWRRCDQGSSAPGCSSRSTTSGLPGRRSRCRSSGCLPPTRRTGSARW